jgi:NifU-like protein involved in Fe-S cluster formation
LEQPDGKGTEGAPGAGNYMVITLQLRDGVIASALFQTYGCPGAIACGSCLTEWVTGLGIEEAKAITPSALATRLGGLPLGKEHCADLAVAALQKALCDAGAGPD